MSNNSVQKLCTCRYYVSPLVILLPETFEFQGNILTGGSKITFDVLMWSDEALDVVQEKLIEEQEGTIDK